MWTFTGFDASAHVSEETHDPARRAPWGSSLGPRQRGRRLRCWSSPSRSPSAICPPPPPTLTLPSSSCSGALGAGLGPAALGLAILAMWFCGLSAVTSLSARALRFRARRRAAGSNDLRARERPLPHPARRRRRSPSACPMVLGLSSALLCARLGSSPSPRSRLRRSTFLGAPRRPRGGLARRGDWTRRGPWHLGRAGFAVSCGAVLWSLFVLATAALPHHGAFLGVLAGVVAALASLYAVFFRGRFTGPPKRPLTLTEHRVSSEHSTE